MPSHPISVRSIFILSSHLRLGLPSGLFPSVFPLTSYHMRHMLCWSILPDLIILILIYEEYKLWSSSCDFLQPPIITFLFGRNILNSLFSDTFSLSSSLTSETKFYPRTLLQTNFKFVYFNLCISRQHARRRGVLKWINHYPNLIWSYRHHIAKDVICYTFPAVHIRHCPLWSNSTLCYE
jgi:hypothetical protein